MDLGRGSISPSPKIVRNGFFPILQKAVSLNRPWRQAPALLVLGYYKSVLCGLPPQGIFGPLGGTRSRCGFPYESLLYE